MPLRGWAVALVVVSGLACQAQPTDSCGVDLKRLTRQAERGSAADQFRLAEMYASGACVPRDDAKAAGWYKKSAEHGNAQAQFALGYWYTEGRELPVDARQAAYWLRKAADQRLSKAQYALGTAYVQGRGVPKDLVEGYKWIRISGPANDDHVRAVLENLGRSMTAEDIRKAEQSAKDWSEKHAGGGKRGGG